MLQPRSERIQLSSPIAATAGAAAVQIVDLSPTGFKLHHRDPLPPRGETLSLRITWKGAAVRIPCTVVWTTIQQLARSTGERPTFASGVRIDPSDAAAASMVASMLAELGPAGTGPSAERGSSAPRTAPYLFCELLGGKWERRPAARPDQPADGFTVSASEEPSQVERLCSAYATGDSETRKLIRTLAALSIKSQGGEPAASR